MRGAKLEHLGNTHGHGIVSSSGAGGSQKGAGKSKPKLERETGERMKTARVDNGRVDSRAESKAGKAAGRWVRSVVMASETGAPRWLGKPRGSMFSTEKSRVDRSTNGGRFNVSVVRAAGNVTEGGNDFSRRVECSTSKLARKSKQPALRLVAAWVAGARGTRSSTASAEQPRMRLVKAADNDAG